MLIHSYFFASNKKNKSHILKIKKEVVAISTIESIVVAILFLIPGFLVMQLDKRINPKINKNTTEIEKTIKALMLSLIVFFINFIFIRLVRNDISTIQELYSNVLNIKFCFIYFCISIISIIITEVFYNIFSMILLKALNIMYSLQNRNVEENKEESVWELIFENKDIDLSNYVVVIKRNGTIVSRGCIDSYSPAICDNKEFKLNSTDVVESYFKDDKTKELLTNVEFEYYDINNDMLIQFYNAKELIAYLEADD